MQPISHTDLILNPDGSVYHLHLLPEDVSDTVILVGDPGRVRRVSSHFDQIDLIRENREFVTHTGTLGGKRLSVLSTGIGTDNIDIVLNELDALVNIDLERRRPTDSHRTLNLIRIGTSGALHADISPGVGIITQVAGGFDSLYHFYKDPENHNLQAITDAFTEHTGWPDKLSDPYFIQAPGPLAQRLAEPGMASGITLSTPGFYAPQLRSLRLSPADPKLIGRIESFRFEHLRINNFEMESSALYALAAMLHHHAVTVCVAVANRISLEFLEDYEGAVDALIEKVLHKLTGNDRERA